MDKKALRLYRILISKYALMFTEINNMKIDDDVKHQIKISFLESIERIKVNYQSLIDRENFNSILFLVGIEVNDFNAVIRRYGNYLGNNNINILEDYVDYINYKINKYFKL